MKSSKQKAESSGQRTHGIIGLILYSVFCLLPFKERHAQT